MQNRDPRHGGTEIRQDQHKLLAWHRKIAFIPKIGEAAANITEKLDSIRQEMATKADIQDLKEVILSAIQPLKEQKKPKPPLIFIPHPYPEPPNFTGRTQERQMLNEWLREDREHPLLSLVAIVQSGMGKSHLAWPGGGCKRI